MGVSSHTLCSEATNPLVTNRHVMIQLPEIKPLGPSQLLSTSAPNHRSVGPQAAATELVPRYLMQSAPTWNVQPGVAGGTTRYAEHKNDGYGMTAKAPLDTHMRS